MARQDWLVGRNRAYEGEDRIYAAASELISRFGFEAFSIQALAAMLNCSQATIYRRAGGKAAIREAVTMRAGSRIAGLVLAAVNDMRGAERVVTAITLALIHIRAEPLGDLMMGSIRPTHNGEWLTASPGVARLAQEVLGDEDPLSAQWLLRVTLALWYWPADDPATERTLVERFVRPLIG
jgi:AcrR family transcriptional regulator